MQGMMKRFRNWMMETGTLLSEPQPKTAEAEIRAMERRQAIAGGRTTPSYEIEPSDRKIGGSGAIESFPHYLKSTITPLTKEFRVDLDEALGMPDVVIVNGSRFMPEIEPDNARRPTLADLNSIRIALAQRVKVEETRRSRSANVMRRASDMLGYLSRELVAQDRRLFEANAEVERQTELARVYRQAQLTAEQRLKTMTTSEQGHRNRIKVVEEERDTARRERDSFEAALNAQAETSAKLSTMYGAGHENTEAEAVERADHLNCPTCGGSGHIDDVPESKAGEVAETLAMLERSAVWFEDKSTGDNPESARLLRQTATLVGRLEKERDTALAQVTALSQPRIVNVAGLVDADLAERYESLRESEARLRKLVERISRWTDAEVALVSAKKTRHIAQVVLNGADPDYPSFDGEERPVSGVSLYREIDALGGTYTAAAGRMYGVAITDALEILGRREFTEHADPAPTYDATERNAAINAVAKHGARIESSGLWANVDEIVDLTARTLGMRRAGA